MTPERWWSTRGERLPFIQSRATRRARADRLVGGFAGQERVQVLARGLGLGAVVVRHALAQPPGEDVADRALAGLVAVGALDDAAVDDPADAGYLGECGAVEDVAGGGPHDGEHPAVLHGARGGCGDVGVDIAGGDGDAFGQSGPVRGPAAQGADAGAQRGRRVLRRVAAKSAKSGWSRARKADDG